MGLSWDEVGNVRNYPENTIIAALVSIRLQKAAAYSTGAMFKGSWIVTSVLYKLNSFVQEHGYWYSIADEAAITDALLNEIRSNIERRFATAASHITHRD